MPSSPKTLPRRPKVAWRPEELWGEWLGMELWIFHQQRWEFHGHQERNIADVPRCLLFGDPALLQHSKKRLDLTGRTASFAVFWGSSIIFDDVSYHLIPIWSIHQARIHIHLSLGMCWAQP
jgi:hypothetical protein